MKNIRTIAMTCLLALASTGLRAQVTFTHTTNADFQKGIAENVLIKNDGLAMPAKKASINDWTSTTNLPQNLSGHQMATWRSFVFLSGGHNGSNYNNYVYRATVNTTGISGWTQLGNLPDSVGFHAMVATETKLYVLGGKKNNYVSNKIYMATINDDGSLGGWSLSPVTLPQELWGLRVEIVNGYLYLVGGGNTATAALSTVYYSRINAEDNLATFTATTAIPGPRNGHTLAKYNGVLYLLGGHNAGYLKKSNVYYTTINANGTCGTWLSATPLPEAISNHVSTCSNGIISVIGGEGESILSNKFYFADIDNMPAVTWELSDRYLYDRTKNAAAFSGDNQIVYAGGTNLSGSAVNSIRYAALNPSANKVKKGIYLSPPFFVGSPKNIQKLAYTISTQTGDNYELLYRIAGADKIWGDWISAGTANPAMINQSQSYIQYMFRLLANAANDIVVSDLTMTVSGFTQLCGSLDAMTTLTSASSPYWATCNISFNTGTHTIQPGVTIYFSPNTGLEIGQASVNFAGTAVQPVKLSFYDTPDGLWNGVYFKDASDAGGVTSQLTYTTIEKAGNGTNNANLWCSATNQPVISNCTIQNSVGHGVRLEGSNVQISNTMIMNNSESGLYLSSSNPTLTSVTTKLSGYAGIYYATAGLAPVYSNMKSESNLYGLYSPTPDNSFAPVSASALQLLNNTTDIALAGGYITANRTWKYFPKGYVLLGNVTVRQGGVNPILTIAPGTTIKTVAGSGLYIGEGSTTGGQLYAVGKADSLITFTSNNGASGGWNGLYFNDGSDYNSTSNLRYCIVENGNEYNIFSVNANEPHIMFSTIRNSVTYGIKLQTANINIEETTIKKAGSGIYLDNSSPSMVLTTFDSIIINCIIRANAGSVPNYFQCTMKNSKFGILYNNPDSDIPSFTNVSFNNIVAAVAINGGSISSNRTWYFNPYGYNINGNITVGLDGGKCRLTIKPGIIIKFIKNTQLQIGNYYWQDYYGHHNIGGELFAEGKSDSLIIFTSANDSVGGWNGIYFHDFSDWATNSISLLKYCTIQKAKQYNVLCSSTTQPTINNCQINLSQNYGLQLESSPISVMNSTLSGNGNNGIMANNSLITISNLIVTNNSGYPIYYNNAYYMNQLKNIDINGNAVNAVAINGGTISDNRIWYSLGNIPYRILNNLLVGQDGGKCRLTIKPGTIIQFIKSTQLQVGNYYWQDYYGHHNIGGELYAEGKSDSLIIFTSANDSVGGWNGIYFHDFSDWAANSVSLLKYCKIQKAFQYNVLCSSTNQPTINYSQINFSQNYGLQFESSPISVTNSTISGNGNNGIVSNNSLLSLSDLIITNNGGYPVLYNNAHYANLLKNLSINGNMINAVAINGGNISDNRTWNALGSTPYRILSNLQIGQDGGKCRLTIMPGSIIQFAKNTQLQVGHYYWQDYYGPHNLCGELYAEGKSDSIITFTPVNDSIGGWNGIYFHDRSDYVTGAFSLLKYCKIQKANQYNIWCNNTSQPTIERTIIAQSAGYGLWLDAANITVKNSTIRSNTGYGIYLSANSNPVIGNNFVSACDIYNNSYNVYNNTSNNIDMRYNFLGSCDSSYLEKKIWDKTDNNSLGRINFSPYSWLPAAQSNSINLSGKLLYDNKTAVPMSGDSILIKDQSTNTTIAKYKTTSTGSFSFSNLNLSVPTTLQIKTTKPWAGVNSTDALAVMRHFTFLSLLDANHWFISDVNRSKTLNGTDAMMIMQRYSGVITSFPTGNLQIDCDSVILTNPSFTYNLSALWFGDANGSWTPGSKKSASIGMVYEGAIHPGSFEAFSMRIRVKERADLGAISLSFRYPEEFLEVNGVKLTSTGEELMYTAGNGRLRIAWYRLDPVALAAEEVLLEIRFRSKDLSGQTMPISVYLEDESELANQEAVAYEGLMLSAPVIPGVVTGIQPGSGDEDQRMFSFFPNPAKQSVTFLYTLEKSENVRITLTDFFGREVAVICNEEQSAGEHRRVFDLSGIEKGVYFVRLYAGETFTPSETRKLIVQ